MRPNRFLSSLFAVMMLCALAAGQNVQPAAASDEVRYMPGLDTSLMDTSQDPCNNFYLYSCGNWLKKNPIPGDQASWGRFNELAEQNRVLLRQILEKAKPGTQRDAVHAKIGDYYAACMDESAVEKAGASALDADLKQIAKLKSKSAMAGLFAGYQMSNVSGGFNFGSDQDFKDSTQFIAEADQGGLGMPDRDYYTEEKHKKLLEQYQQHVTNMFKLLGDKPEVAAENAKVVVAIETELAKGSMTRVERRDPQKLYHKISRADFTALTPTLAWDSFFTGVGLPGTQSLNVVTLDYFKQLETTLKAHPLDHWKTYLRWHLVHSRAAYLSKAFVDENFDFYSHKLRGTEEQQPRWKRCVRYVDRDLGEDLGQAYVEDNFGAEGKRRTLKMVQQIEKAMEQDVNGLPWMSDATKKAALVKLAGMANKIGYPDKWRDYSSYQVKPGDFVGNVERGALFENRRQLAKIGKPVDKGEWLMTPPTVNAYYNPQMNDINFPAGILQPPFFDPKMDDAPNYGDTGGTNGHELTHGFDDEGRQFDAAGNLRDWWTEEDGKKFTERASCISDQYSGYVTVKDEKDPKNDVHINGKLTLGEDVADLGGLILAWMAWKAETAEQALKPIEGFTPEQRFFIGYAQSWCENERVENKRLAAATDPHSPPEFRTNGVVVNMPEFEKAFACKKGSAMVKENRCRVW